MKHFFNSFYGKLSVVFLLLLLVMATVQIFLTINSWKSYYEQADQELNLRLAKDMAAELKPFVKDSLDLEEVHHSIHYMMVMNPKVEIYLLDDEGKILAFFAEPQKKVKAQYVNLIPLKHFLGEQPQFPILGDDPRNPGLTKPFSAAPLKIGSTEGFLYVILGSEQFDMAISTNEKSYVAWALIKGLFITVLFTGIIGLILFAFLTRRIRLINTIVAKFSKGQYDARIEVKSSDEIGNLSKSFNKMADTIEANIDELKKTDKLRRELIANVSHDLRNPLASIRGYLETIQIKESTLTAQERQKYIDIILDSTHGLEKLVEQLFELSKLDAKQVEPQYEPFLIKDMIFDVIAKFKPKADKENISLNAEISDGLPQVFADIGMIERVLSNLVDNAIRYTPAGGTVYISTDHDDNKIIRVHVKDTGPGIDQEQLPYIFNRFYRIEKSRSDKTGGTGLGLAIASKIMEIHKSTLSAASEINRGSVFSFNLKTWQP